MREISAPTEELCNLQKRLANLLQDCDAEIRRTIGVKRTIAHGFVRRRSIMTNARQHVHRRFVFNTDLEGFFDAINFGRVRGFFITNKNFQLHQDVATIIAQIACRQNALPQGAPTSPVVSNLIGHILDIHVAKLAAEAGCVYSRYADDLTFSTNEKKFPEDIAVNSGAEPHRWVVGERLRKIIEKQGFAINETKSRMHYADSRQEVTGLVVNRRVNVRSDYRARVRQMVQRLTNTGAFTVRHVDKSNQIAEKEGNIHQLGGMLSFIHSVNRYDAGRFPKHGDASRLPRVDGFKKVYCKFLLYKDFFGSDRPVLMFEGRTDNIYIRSAIRSLAKSFPALAQVDGNGKVTLDVRLYNYTSTTREVLGLGGGSDNLKKFLILYRKVTAKFRAPEPKCPVIILIDNDNGAKQIYGVLRDMTGSQVTGNESFIRVCKHIYVVPTPKIGGAESCIEDFFDNSTLSVMLAGKNFDKSNDFDSEKSYGKVAFAKAVVKRNEKAIDFSGFAPILSTIDSIIDAHGE
jgi:hypothetical protein